MDFFTNPTIVGWYQNNVKTIVTRVNSITGLAYTDDPAIFGWELINEPHVPGDDTGNILTVLFLDLDVYKPAPSDCYAAFTAVIHSLGSL